MGILRIIWHSYPSQHFLKALYLSPIRTTVFDQGAPLKGVWSGLTLK